MKRNWDSVSAAASAPCSSHAKVGSTLPSSSMLPGLLELAKSSAAPGRLCQGTLLRLLLCRGLKAYLLQQQPRRCSADCNLDDQSARCQSLHCNIGESCIGPTVLA